MAYRRKDNPVRTATVDPEKLARYLERRDAEKQRTKPTSSDYWKSHYAIPTNRKHQPYDKDQPLITELDD